MSRLHRHRGAERLHPTTDRHLGAAHWAHQTDVARWRKRRGRRPRWARRARGEVVQMHHLAEAVR
jgi:hypothetical protein